MTSVSRRALSALRRTKARRLSIEQFETRQLMASDLLRWLMLTCF